MENDNGTLSTVNANSLNWNIQDKFKGLELEEILNHQPKKGFSVCMLNTTGSLNIGVVLRSAVLFGADKFYITGKKKYDKRSTVGAHNYIDVEFLPTYDSNTIIDKIELDGYYPVLLETDAPDIKYMKDDLNYFNKKPCFIFGEERDGISEEFLDKNLPVYSIPTFGVLRSLNVSVAAGIAMYIYSAL
jgi:tRNA G18 (ribose-2'-O)-methylase SpoU